MITIKGEKIPWFDGITILQILRKTKLENKFAVIRLNGRLISKPDFESTTVDDNSNIVPLPMISGG